MVVLKKEVKTFYTIEIDFDEFLTICNTYKTNAVMRTLHPNAFSMIDGLTEANFEMLFKHWVISNGDTINVICEYYGFDGWENAGIYQKRNNTIKIVVYNYGSEM